MPIQSKILAIVVGLAIVIIIFELVRRRRLSEEYSWLWVLTGLVIFVLAIWPNLLNLITRAIGAKFAVSTLFFFGLVFLLLITLHFSVKLSQLTEKINKLTQEFSILQSELKKK